jgi:hypothetical protein
VIIRPAEPGLILDKDGHEHKGLEIAILNYRSVKDGCAAQTGDDFDDTVRISDDGVFNVAGTSGKVLTYFTDQTNYEINSIPGTPLNPTTAMIALTIVDRGNGVHELTISAKIANTGGTSFLTTQFK